MKQCSKCGLHKVEHEFYAKDGRCKCCRKQQASAWNATNKEVRSRRERGRHYLREYGMSKTDVTTLFASQNNRCAICGADRPLRLDHCHSSGKIRGGLCHKCNVGLGHFNDDVKLLSEAINYLQKDR